jgi:hypothetical protein
MFDLLTAYFCTAKFGGIACTMVGWWAIEGQYFISINIHTRVTVNKKLMYLECLIHKYAMLHVHNMLAASYDSNGAECTICMVSTE